MFTNEFRFCQQHHDGRIRVARHSGKRLLRCFVMHRYTGPTRGIIDFGAVLDLTVVLVPIAGTLNSQRYITEMLDPVVLPYIQRLS
ncbi:transposable element Tcb1 transposase [Trichonephila clavipes]|nr:transposable element Tcb1 transposase [Trichonephila clavipes]